MIRPTYYKCLNYDINYPLLVKEISLIIPWCFIFRFPLIFNTPAWPSTAGSVHRALSYVGQWPNFNLIWPHHYVCRILWFRPTFWLTSNCDFFLTTTSIKIIKIDNFSVWRRIENNLGLRFYLIMIATLMNSGESTLHQLWAWRHSRHPIAYERGWYTMCVLSVGVRVSHCLLSLSCCVLGSHRASFS